MAVVIGRFRAKVRNSRIGGTPGGIMAATRSAARRAGPGILDRPTAHGRDGPARAALGSADPLGAAPRTARRASAAEPVRPDVLQCALRAAGRADGGGPGGA